ncbi:hypothetical protein [Streptomyces sp. NPDC053755]|uniref:hypothetical protein n=1 Tax=Streptomyces sp. NPDC053755 TaxID=3155815 RepID=UPI003423F136
MTRRHHFHLDHAGHSVSVTVQTGHGAAVVVLVDGKETGYVKLSGDRPVTVAVELPTDPPSQAVVRVTPGPDAPHCVLEAPGAEPQVMPPRAY